MHRMGLNCQFGGIEICASRLLIIAVRRARVSRILTIDARMNSNQDWRNHQPGSSTVVVDLVESQVALDLFRELHRIACLGYRSKISNT